MELGVSVPGGPEAGFSRPQAPGRTPRPCGSERRVVDEVMIERGREQFGEQLARSRSAGGRLAGDEGFTAR